MPRDLDLGSGHMAYRRASLIDLYLRTKFHLNRRTCLWTDGRTNVHVRTYVQTYVRTDEQKDIEAGFIRPAACAVGYSTEAPLLYQM